MDKYVIEMNRILTALENDAGLSIQDSSGFYLRDAPCSDIVQYLAGQYNGFPAETKKEMAATLGRHVVLITYVDSRLCYFNRKKLDFSFYPFINNVADVLIAFTMEETITQNAMQGLDSIVIILTELDHKNPTVKQTLSYRLLRMFILLELFGFRSSAAAIARFLLNQMITE